MVHFLVALALCYVLIKIPFWVLGSIRGGHRRSLVGSLIRGFIAYKTFGLLRGGGGSAVAARAATRGRKTATPPDPYAKTRATADGQYMIPLPGLKRTRTGRVRPTAPAAPKRLGTPKGSQLRLPADGEWPENKPILQRDGQYRLPLQVNRQPRTPPTAPPPVQPAPRHLPRHQLQLPADGEWPENKPILQRDGQYRLPLQVKRQPRAARPQPVPPATHGDPAAHQARRARQQALPLNLPPKPHRRRIPPDPRRKGDQS